MNAVPPPPSRGVHPNEHDTDVKTHEVLASHLIDDLAKELGAYKRALDGTAIPLLTDALHAIENDRKEVALEFVDRALSALTALRRPHAPRT